MHHFTVFGHDLKSELSAIHNKIPAEKMSRAIDQVAANICGSGAVYCLLKLLITPAPYNVTHTGYVQT
jgi:hypothetical protein